MGCYSVHFPSIRGIATPVCALVRNDRKLEGEAVQTPIYRLPLLLLPGAVEEFSCSGGEEQSTEELLQKGGVHPEQGKKGGAEAPGEDGGENFPEGNALPAAQERGEDGPGQKEEQIYAPGLTGVHSLNQGQPQDQQAPAAGTQAGEESQRRRHGQRNQEV